MEAIRYLPPSNSKALRDLLVKTDIMVIKEKPEFFMTENIGNFIKQCSLVYENSPDEELAMLITGLSHEVGKRLFNKDKEMIMKLQPVLKVLMKKPELCSATLVKAEEALCGENIHNSPESLEFLKTFGIDVDPMLGRAPN